MTNEKMEYPTSRRLGVQMTWRRGALPHPDGTPPADQWIKANLQIREFAKILEK
jgi:hypothetical protein